MTDAFFMEEALKEARAALLADEVPIGAVLVYEGQIIARAHNQVETLQDATAHAEMLCLRSAAEKLGNWRLLGATLYCTLEPCSMCAGALLLSRVQNLVWGAPDLRQGAHGSWVNLLDLPHPIHNCSVRKGILQEECAALLTDFFRKKREQKK